jgi:4-hydroxybenzoate polyprenyltransferase
MGLNFIFGIAWAIAVIGWVGQYIRLREPEIPRTAYGEIFRQNVWLGFILLLGIILGM